jgi:hypothetical protein
MLPQMSVVLYEKEKKISKKLLCQLTYKGSLMTLWVILYTRVKTFFLSHC